MMFEMAVYVMICIMYAVHLFVSLVSTIVIGKGGTGEVGKGGDCILYSFLYC